MCGLSSYYTCPADRGGTGCLSWCPPDDSERWAPTSEAQQRCNRWPKYLSRHEWVTWRVTNMKICCYPYPEPSFRTGLETVQFLRSKFLFTWKVSSLHTHSLHSHSDNKTTLGSVIQNTSHKGITIKFGSAVERTVGMSFRPIPFN